MFLKLFPVFVTEVSFLKDVCKDTRK